jgi:ATP-dependent exoDNAse (exonuclease V) alpha subunit
VQRYCTLAHLDTEQQILTAAKRTVLQLVSQEQACAAAERTRLNAGQPAAVITMLTATTATTALVAAAGTGKSHTMAEFARLWTSFTGRRVIGLATATNAARVLTSEGLAESYNVAAFLGKTPGSDRLRRPVPLHQDDVLVLDEASQLSTTDLAMVQEAARTTGARLVLVGDTEQLGAVEAGGMFRLLAAYREAAGITDPGQAIAPEPHRGNPELDHLRQAAIRALEIRDETEIICRMTHGELEARILDGDRVQASAPPDLSRDLRLTVHAEADAWQQSAAAEVRHDPTGSAAATALARHVAAQREQLEAANARYETWATGTSERREAAGKARAELERRGLAQQAAEQRQPETEGEPPTTVEWWRQLEADVAAADRAIEREQQTAIAAGKPWPPQHESELVRGPQSSPGSDPEADGQSGPDDRTARLDQLRAQAAEAAGRFTAEKDDREARAHYAARLEREAHAEPERTLQAEASYEAEIEL